MSDNVLFWLVSGWWNFDPMKHKPNMTTDYLQKISLKKWETELEANIQWCRERIEASKDVTDIAFYDGIETGLKKADEILRGLLE